MPKRDGLDEKAMARLDKMRTMPDQRESHRSLDSGDMFSCLRQMDETAGRRTVSMTIKLADLRVRKYAAYNGSVLLASIFTFTLRVTNGGVPCSKTNRTASWRTAAASPVRTSRA